VNSILIEYNFDEIATLDDEEVELIKFLLS